MKDFPKHVDVLPLTGLAGSNKNPS